MRLADFENILKNLKQISKVKEFSKEIFSFWQHDLPELNKQIRSEDTQKVYFLRETLSLKQMWHN